jgi:hypothetical protein
MAIFFFPHDMKNNFCITPSHVWHTYRPVTFVFALLTTLLMNACTGNSQPMELPNWMEPTARWRNATPPINTTKLDLAAARYAKSYRELQGPAHYREFAVPQSKSLADVTSAIDAALAKAGDAAEKRQVAGALDDASEITWTQRNGKKIVMVYLTNVDPARKDAPAFVLLFEPK